MKSKARRKRERALRLGLSDPTITSGVTREEVNSFYKRGGRTPSKIEITRRKEKKHKGKYYDGQ